MKSLIYWLSQRAFQLPFAKALTHRSFGYADLFRPIAHTHGDSIQGEPACDRSILLLHFWGGPSDVAWLVMSISIDSVQRMSMWPLAHVTQKFFKTVPTFADRDSTTTVMRKHWIVRIATAAQHTLPAFVFARSAIGSMTMKHTAATASVSGGEAAAADERVIATLAATEPYDKGSIALRRWSNRGQFAERVPSEIAGGSHAFSSFIGDGVVRGWRTSSAFVGLGNYTAVFT